MSTRKRDPMVELPPAIVDTILKTLTPKQAKLLTPDDKFKLLVEAGELAKTVAETLEKRDADAPAQTAE